MTSSDEVIFQRLRKAHEQEDAYNTELGQIDKDIRRLLARKDKLRRLVSMNMRHRNQLIQCLSKA